MQFKEKFIAFIDILGYKQMVLSSENGTGMPLDELIQITKLLGVSKEHGKCRICPQSTYIQRDFDFKINQVSDCVIISSEISPASIINLVCHCNGVVDKLLIKGIMCRGYITKGKIYHDGEHFIGSGYHEVLSKEKEVCAFKREADERGTPYVEVDRIVCDYVSEFGDACVNKMFSRVVKADGTITVLFPFKQLYNAYRIGGYGNKFDPNIVKQDNDNIRQLIKVLKERLMSFVDINKPIAVQKATHYINALDAQLAACDEQDKMIDKLCAPFQLRKIECVDC